jgi:succinylarginine dihydrolase
VEKTAAVGDLRPEGMEVDLIAYEVNFDGIVGPTHNYAGLSFGNLASQKHEQTASNPREAALQGLAKMKYLADLGLKQAVLPPQRRPDLAMLRRVGFGGSDADVLWQASRQEPRLLPAAYSASSMWAANAATVSPSADAADGRVHFTPANLVTQFHRSMETAATGALLKSIFADESAFVHHPPLPASGFFADEGAANHTRLARSHGAPGVEIFVYGRSASDASAAPARFPARQTLEASSAITRLHGLAPIRVIFAQQHPNAVDAGAFHNDVVCVGNGDVMLYHARAFAEAEKMAAEIRRKFAQFAGSLPLHLIEVPEERVSLKDAVSTYLFNSQLVTLPGGKMALIAPIECQEHAGVAGFIQSLIEADNPIESAHFLDVRQSMRNGGGPACLRLRVVLTESELAKIHPGVLLTDSLYADLVAWVNRTYRDVLRPEDLADPLFAREAGDAVGELTALLKLPGQVI